ncbi:AI-2E family transporter, partial [bacterium]|nr:AI-2E family transporter [bacterium]
MGNKSNQGHFIWLLIVGAVIALLLFFYSIQESLTPVFAFFILILFLWPLRNTELARYFMILTLIVFLIWIVGETRNLLTPFALSFLLAYLFDPVVQYMEKLKWPRWLSVLIIVILALGFFAVFLIFLIPKIIEQVSELVDLGIRYTRKLADWVESGGLKPLSTYIQIDTEKIQEFILTNLSARVQEFFKNFFTAARGVASSLYRLINQILILVLVPFLFFYILKDFSKIKKWLNEVLYENADEKHKGYFLQLISIINGFFRGQLIVCLIVWIFTSAGLLILGVKQALILGIIAGVLNIIPHFGIAITLAVGVAIGLLSHNPLVTTLKIVAVIETIQILDGTFLSPRIVGGRVGLHPVWVILSILIFSYFWGFLGFILAVPVAASLRVFISALLDQYKRKKSVGPAPYKP